ncbi:hypothetical protein [Methyloferula stellata]|uniref:hypothetical protein n=1 Tax=Methyloferula stellata TaxID=876270 RepID=UPI000370AFAB|nr:hypothetical protein [Methyloferula stellata]
MELLNWWALNVILTALLVSSATSFIVSIAAVRIRPAAPAGSFWLLFLAVFAFSMLGFVTGQILGDSRESVVGSVVPAVLTLLGGVVAYIFSSKGIRSQTAISAVLVCFTFSFLVGSLFGIRLRIEYEYSLQDPAWLSQRDLALEQNKLAVEIQRLQNYVVWLQLRNEFAEKDKLDLSRFETIFEKSKEKEKESKSPDEPTGSSHHQAEPHSTGPAGESAKPHGSPSTSEGPKPK